jgi:hypothetical protein
LCYELHSIHIVHAARYVIEALLNLRPFLLLSPAETGSVLRKRLMEDGDEPERVLVASSCTLGKLLQYLNVAILWMMSRMLQEPAQLINDDYHAAEPEVANRCPRQVLEQPHNGFGARPGRLQG